MKKDFIIIAGILVIITFLPFILFPLLGNREKNNLRTRFKEEARALALNISYELLWNNNIAGVDRMKKHFLFVQKPDRDFSVHHINLQTITQITMVPHYLETRREKIPVQILSRIDLEFYDHFSPVPVIVNLFDDHLNYLQDFELKNAQNLVAELQKNLTLQPVLKRTA